MSAPTVKVFLDTLKRQLDQFSADELRSAVLELARGLEPSERAAFLAAFAPTRSPSRKTARKKNPGKKLLEEIQAFAERVEGGEYADGWGWDHELHDERLFGDESWLDEALDYLAAARGLFADGEWELSRDAAKGVFEAIQAGFYEGVLPGEEVLTPPDAALEEAVYRYLCAVYLAAEPAERPAALMDGFRTVWGLVSDARLEGLLEVSEEELPGIEAFGEAWIAFLNGAEAGSPMSRLLHEAVRIFRGAGGLATLARSRGKADPEAYVAWVTCLRHGGDMRDAVDAALEALGALPRGLSVRAQLADLLRGAAATLGDGDTVDRARYEAFFGGPTLTRLLCWIEGAADDAERELRLAEAASRIEEIEARRVAQRTPMAMQDQWATSRAEPGLPQYVRLLRGEYGTVGKTLDKAPPLGWSSSDHPGPLAVPFFLAAACGLGTRGSLGPNLEALWSSAAEVPRIYFGITLRDEDRPARSLREHLEESLRISPLGEGSAERFFRKAEKAALARVHAIVSEKHRKSYDRAARLLMAVADGYRCLGLEGEAEHLVARFREHYPRHRAFLAELKTAANLAAAPAVH